MRKSNNSRDLAVRKKQIQPIFSVEIIDIDQQLPGTAEAVGLYSSSNFPKHRNVHIRIENVQELRFEMLLFLTDIIFSCLNRMNLKIFMWFIRIHQMPTQKSPLLLEYLKQSMKKRNVGFEVV